MWYKLTFKQLQPINLGYKKHGVINETRIFIAGQTIWGALSRAYFEQTKEYYEHLFENITCFYPTIGGKVLYPTYRDGEFYLGENSEKKFRKDYVSTSLSTAINPQTRNAKDESLHEIDVILPKNISWVGYLKIDEDIELPNEIYIGSDSRYGLGLMRLEDKVVEEYPFNVYKGIYENEYPRDESTTNFVKFSHQKFMGELELLVEFDFYQKALNPKLKNSGFYIGVGSEII